MDELTVVCEEVKVVGTEDRRAKVFMSGVDESSIQEIEQLREKCLHLESIIEDRDGMIMQLQQALKDE